MIFHILNWKNCKRFFVIMDISSKQDTTNLWQTKTSFQKLFYQDVWNMIKDKNSLTTIVYTFYNIHRVIK